MNSEGKLYVIRHADMGKEYDKFCQSRVDTLPSKNALLAKKRQAREHLKNKEVKKIYSSPLPRAIQTAQIIAKELDIKEIIIEDLFNDLDFGYFTSRRPSKIKEIQPEMYDERNFFRYEVALKGGESLADLEKRVRFGLKKINNETQENVIIVTHGSVITMIHKVIHNRDYYEFYPHVEEGSYEKIFNF